MSPKLRARLINPFTIILFGSLALLWLFIQLSPHRESIEDTQLPWNAYYDDQGQLHALGLSLGESTLQEAMNLYGKDVEIRLFTDGDGNNKTAEAYLPVIYIGSIKGAIAMRLNVSQQELETVYRRGAKIKPTQSGAREIKLSSEDNLAFLNKVISSATLIPRKDLNERAIDIRFGQPDRKEKQSDGLDHWFYDQMGLEMIIDREGPEALQYSP